MSNTHLTFVNWILLGCAVIFAIVLVRAFRTGVLIVHKGPEIRRAERPIIFWIAFVGYCVIMAGCVFGLIMW
jgi:hypothetical protein